MSSTPVPTPPAWASLEEGVDHIMTRHQTGVSYSKYMSLYTIAYSYCTSSTMLNHSKMIGRSGATNSMGSDLYNSLLQYLIIHLRSLRASVEPLENEALLQYYSTEWLRYTTGANYINRLFANLLSHWVKRERDGGRKAVYPVYTLALVQWKNNLFIPIQQKQTKLTTAILHLIQNQRNGSMIDQGLVKRVVDSFVSLGFDDTDPHKACFDVYREHFEAPFIDATERYYTLESESFLASNNTTSAYLKKAEQRLREEEDRVDRYLNSRTRKPLIAKCEHVLIKRHAQVMWDSFQGLLESDREEDLQRMFGLLARIPGGLEPLRKRFEEHVKKSGCAAVEKLVGGQASSALDPKAYVDALLEVHEKNSETVIRIFRGEAGFVASLDNACREFVNRNAATGLKNARSPELLAKHADLLLRKNNKLAKEDDLEVALDRVMILFKYIEDKDVFEKVYTSRLSKRVIHGVSASDESEASMISKLKEVCGFEYTNKLQRMFTDMSLSKDLTDAFKEQSHDDIDISFSIMVLGTNFWPLTPPTYDFIIPSEILTTSDRFQTYYQRKHSGRKLTWLWNHSKNELWTNYTNQKYILTTSAYQMGVLVLYNNSETLRFAEIKEATGLDGEVLSQVLGLLVRAKVLICDNDSGGQYDLNPNFRSEKVRVNLNLPIREAEISDVSKKVDEDRKYVIQNIIYRIMKFRKRLTSQALFQEVVSQISQSQKFAPKIPEIKKAIEMLLEKEAIERVDGMRHTFAFVSY